MAFTKFRLDRNQLHDFHRHIEEFTGTKIQPVQMPDYPATTNGLSPLLYGYEVDEAFLEKYPHWRSHIER